MTSYAEFLEHKAQLGPMDGFEPRDVPSWLFDFQAYLFSLSLRRGRHAVLADCGLGKSPIELAWADAVVRHTNRPVLLLTPLAVGAQMVREAAKFGVEVEHSRDGTMRPGARVVITNYEQLHRFDRHAFAGAVCDEASCLKAFDGARRAEVTAFLRKMPYRLLGTATAAPNDYVELGTLSEALGELGFMDMLGRFFKNDQNTSDTKRLYRLQGGAKASAGGEAGGVREKWRFKGHAEEPFWRWVASWARVMRRPSDLGFDDARFVLPPLDECEHLVESTALDEGMIAPLPAVGLAEERAERRRTLRARCERVAALVADTGQAALVWCQFNAEGDLLETLIPDAVQVHGRDSDAAKEAKFLAFTSGEARVLVTKEKIGAWGLNFQHCAHVLRFPSHSFEQYYQGIRRCWRYGQTRPVRVDTVLTASERSVQRNVQRKAAAADRMFDALVAHMHRATRVDRARVFENPVEVPAWL